MMLLKKIILVISVMFSSHVAIAGVSAGIAGTKGGYGADIAIPNEKGDAVVHAIVGIYDGGHQYFLDHDGNNQFFASADYDLLAPANRSMSVYAGLGVRDVSACGPALRMPLGIQANFTALPIQVALEAVPSLHIEQGQGATRIFLDAGLSVRAILD